MSVILRDGFLVRCPTESESSDLRLCPSHSFAAPLDHCMTTTKRDILVTLSKADLLELGLRLKLKVDDKTTKDDLFSGSYRVANCHPQAHDPLPLSVEPVRKTLIASSSLKGEAKSQRKTSSTASRPLSMAASQRYFQPLPTSRSRQYARSSVSLSTVVIRPVSSPARGNHVLRRGAGSSREGRLSPHERSN